MYELKPNETEFLERCAEARKVALSFKNPLVIHHFDADGISSGAIVQTAFRNAGIKYRAKWIKKLDDKIIEEVHSEQEIIFCDLGGGNKRVNELSGDVLIIDHHQTEGVEKLQINPLLFGIDGGDELSSAGATFCIFRNDVDVAITGAVGDMQHPLKGMNRWVLEQGVQSGRVVIENDLRFYGRYSRPLLQFLLYSDDPYVPGISYNEEGAKKLIADCGINQKENGNEETARENWQKYGELNENEKRKIVSALAEILMRNGMANKAKTLVGESYVFPHREQGSETYEASEFSTLLNACGRHGKAEIGVRVCMNGDGKDTEAMMTAHSLLLHHRKMIRDGISFAKENVQDLGKFYFLDGRGKIDEGIIGIICGMWLHPMAKKPVLGVSDGEPAADGKPMIKISSRANRLLLAEGVNLGIAIKETCEGIAHGAIGGGHRIAAGASVPKEKINEFLTRMGESLDKQRKNE
ncbi:TPA: DHH family phosphoesterase [Candidatus Micrarchaeota archaeon]|nr:DHH family phosphoesterase [Candidatus Micrarchaeota archaeon]